MEMDEKEAIALDQEIDFCTMGMFIIGKTNMLCFCVLYQKALLYVLHAFLCFFFMFFLSKYLEPDLSFVSSAIISLSYHRVLNICIIDSPILL